MEATQAQQAAAVERNHGRAAPVPKGRRAFAMKRRMYAGSFDPHAHACNIIGHNRLGMWSQRNQGNASDGSVSRSRSCRKIKSKSVSH
uniref:Uncharacterized protein n=1 Tax=Leersia perrieri TaxID=77586 RepID=A0A0D9VLI8_9ORYZ